MWTEPSHYSFERQAARLRDNYVCQYCDKQPELVTTDHVLPRHRGGADSRHNLVCACADCNGDKGAMTPKEWYYRLTLELNESWSVSERLYRRIGNLQARFDAGGPPVQAALPLDAPPAASGKGMDRFTAFPPDWPGGKFEKDQLRFPFCEKPSRLMKLAA